jgi:tetratricopeptide (TPR) repeat protein
MNQPEHFATPAGHSADRAVLMQQAAAASARGERETALELYRVIAAAFPAFHLAAVRIAGLLAEMGRLDEADAELERVLKLVPTDRAALMQRAATTRLRGEREAALELYRDVAHRHPDFDNPLIHVASLLRELGRLDEADAEIDALLQRRPDHPGGLLQRGQTAEARQSGSGRTWFERAIAAQPDVPGPYLSLIQSLVKAGEESVARTLLADACSRFPQSAQFPLRRAELDWSSGKLDEAFAQIEALADRFPADFNVWRQRVAWATVLGRFDQAARLLDAAVAPTVLARRIFANLRATLAARQMDFAAARPYLREMLTLPPVTAADHQALAQNLLYTLDLDEARRQLEAAARLRLAAQGTNAEDDARVARSIRSAWLNEFSVNPFAVQRLRSALALPLARQAPALAEILREEPGHTPTAILLMIQLRRSGYFQTLREAAGTASAWPAAIPRRVLQFWDTAEVPADVAALMASWPRVCADFEYTRFDEPGARNYLQNHYEPAVLRAFQKCRVIAMKADLFRLAFLFREGGVYADADDRCRHPIIALGRSDADLILYQEPPGSLGNNFIAAAPGHPVLGDALDHAVKEILESSHSHTWFATGPGQMTRAAARQLRPWLRATDGPLQRWIVLDCCELLSCISIGVPCAYHKTEKSWGMAEAQLRR